MNHLVRYLMLFCVTFFSFPIKAFSETDFKLELFQEILLISAGFGLNMAGDKFISDVKPPEPYQLDNSEINPVDRWAVKGKNGFYSEISDMAAGATAIGAGAVAVLGDRNNDNRGRIFDFTMLMEGNQIIMGLTRSAKGIFERPRPYAYVEPPGSLGNDSALSFWSLHSANAFMNAVFAGYLFQERNPDSKYVKTVWATGLSLATISAASRVAAGEHFPTDVLAGAAAGAFVGWIIPRFHRTDRDISLTTQKDTVGLVFRGKF